MKKIFILFITLLFVAGCGNSDLTNLDLNKASIAAENTLKNMANIDSETLENVYGLDLSLVDEYVIKENDDGEVYAIIKTKNKSDVKEDMEEYFSKIKEFDEAYSPERLEILENRTEKEIGDYLIYIVSSSADNVYKDIVNTME